MRQQGKKEEDEEKTGVLKKAQRLVETRERLRGTKEVEVGKEKRGEDKDRRGTKKREIGD